MGELARKPGCPEPADTPLGLLTPRPGEGYTLLDKWLLPVGCSVCGVGIIVSGNIILKRPLWAGIYLHLISGGLGYGIGSFIRDTKFAAKEERDAVLKDYINLHPEDFPPFERKRFADIYYPFKPIR